MFNYMRRFMALAVMLGITLGVQAQERVSGGLDLNHPEFFERMGPGWENCQIYPDDTPLDVLFPYYEITRLDDPMVGMEWERGIQFSFWTNSPNKIHYINPMVRGSFEELKNSVDVKDVFWFNGQIYILREEPENSVWSYDGKRGRYMANWLFNGRYTNGVRNEILEDHYSVKTNGEIARPFDTELRWKIRENVRINLYDSNDDPIDQFRFDLNEWYKYNDRFSEKLPSPDAFNTLEVIRDFEVYPISAHHFVLVVKTPEYDWNETPHKFVIALGPYRTKDLEQRLWDFLNGIGNGFAGEVRPTPEEIYQPDPVGIEVLFPELEANQVVALGTNTVEARGGDTLEVQVKVNDAESNPVLDAFGIKTGRIPARSKLYALVVIGNDVLFAPGFTREMQGIDIVPGKGIYHVLTLPVPKGLGKTKAHWMVGVLDEDFNIIGDIHEVDTDIGD